MKASTNRKSFGRAVMALAILALLTFTAAAPAEPIIDGRLDPAEGYTDGWTVDFAVENAVGTVTGGQLWVYQDIVSGDVSVWFGLPVTLVDNTYGVNAIGWGKNVAPSGKNHNFKDLVGSDDLRLAFTNGEGETVLDVVVDYISETGKGTGVYVNRGVLGTEEGDAADVLAVSSSLVYNFNTLGHSLTQDSPATDASYTENPAYPGWLFGVAYEVKVSGDIFGEAGFGGVNSPLAHVSPNKIGKNKVYPDIGDPVPEPMTFALLVVGGMVVAARRRRHRA